MQFAFVRPNGYSEWGGDLKAVQDIQRGIKAFGHESFITEDRMEALEADFVFFIGTLVDRTPDMNFMRLMGREYGCIGFHEDHLLFSGPSFGFVYYVSGILDQSVEEGYRFSLEDLYESPHLISYFDRMRPLCSLQNREFLKGANLIIANSHTEQRTLLRDAPGCRAEVVYWAAGHTGEMQSEPDDSFLRFAGVEKGNYILQVGRMMLRKNQLASLLATKDLDVPLVFIAMNNCEPMYEEIVFAAAKKWRKAPTILISQHLKGSDGPVKVIPTPERRILSKEMILSATANAGLHLHPAFYELPGYTYLESARFGVPTIATEWSSLKDYFAASGPIDDRIEYVLPYDLMAIKRLVEKKFGQKYAPIPDHPLYRREAKDVGRDFLAQVDSIACLR
ncbi:MAG: hypothetical protein JSS32_00725 [Verrucomicrobia bacterium]|nr:hypothetical protein [Verrucomicrobiota bacterium]